MFLGPGWLRALARDVEYLIIRIRTVSRVQLCRLPWGISRGFCSISQHQLFPSPPQIRKSGRQAGFSRSGVKDIGGTSISILNSCQGLLEARSGRAFETTPELVTDGPSYLILAVWSHLADLVSSFLPAAGACHLPGTAPVSADSTMTQLGLFSWEKNLPFSFSTISVWKLVQSL